MSKLVGAVVGTVFAAIGFAIGGPLGASIGFAIGSAVGGALVPAPKGPAREASATTLQLGEYPRTAVFGRAAVSGSLVDAFNYGGTYGTDWELLVIALADHRCDALEGFYINDAYVAFGADGDVAGYSAQLKVWWRSGTETQALPSVVSTNGPGWTSDDNGAGICYAVVAYKADAADSKTPIWNGTRPRFLFIVRGALCYDPRKDSTIAGGSGAHRWATPTTWEWTENPLVCRYNWARGQFACDRVTQPDQVLIGRGLSDIEAPPANLAWRANLCDEVVGGAARYRIGGLIAANQSYLSVEEGFAAACAGTITQPEGAVEIDPGQARAPSFAFTDADLVVGTKVHWQDYLGTGDAEWINTVVPSYIEPAQKWVQHAAPVRRDVADVIADGGSRELALSLGFVTNAAQAGRVGEVQRRLGRLPARGQVTLPPRFCGIEEGDWVTWQSDRYFGGATRTFRVDAWGSDQGWRHQITLRQISSSAYSDTAALTDGSVATIQAARAAIAAPGAGAWVLSAGYLSAGGIKNPTLIVTGASDNTNARFVRTEFVQQTAAPTGATVWTDAGMTGPDVLRAEIPAAPGGTYYAAVSYLVDGVQGPRLVLGPVAVGAATYPDGTPIQALQPAEAGSTAGTNLVANSSYATDTAGWTLSGSAVRVAASAGDPAPYVRMTNNAGAGGHAVYAAALQLGAGQQRIYISFWARMSVAGNYTYLTMTCYDAAGANLGAIGDSNYAQAIAYSSRNFPNGLGDSPNAPGNNQWSLVIGSMALPAGTTKISNIDLQGVPGGASTQDYTGLVMSLSELSVTKNPKVGSQDFSATNSDNLLQNGNFNDGLNGFGVPAAALPYFSVLAGLAGDPMLKFLRYAGTVTTGGIKPRAATIPITGGKDYWLTLRARSSVAGTPIQIVLVANTSAGVYIAYALLTSPPLAAANTLYDLKFKFTAPANAAGIDFDINFTPASNVATVDIASLRLATSELNATLGAAAGTNLFRSDGATIMTQAEVRTPEGVASAVTGQTALATYNAPSYASNAAAITGGLATGKLFYNTTTSTYDTVSTSSGGSAFQLGGSTGSGSITTGGLTNCLVTFANIPGAGFWTITGVVFRVSATADPFSSGSAGSGTWALKEQVGTGTVTTIASGTWSGSFSSGSGSSFDGGVNYNGRCNLAGAAAIASANTGAVKVWLELKTTAGTVTITSQAMAVQWIAAG